MRGEVSGLTTWLVPMEKDRPSTAPTLPYFHHTLDFYGRSNPDPAEGVLVQQGCAQDSIIDFGSSLQHSMVKTAIEDFDPTYYYSPGPSVAQRHYLKQLEEQKEAMRKTTGTKNRPRTAEARARKNLTDEYRLLTKKASVAARLRKTR